MAEEVNRQGGMDMSFGLGDTAWASQTQRGTRLHRGDEVEILEAIGGGLVKIKIIDGQHRGAELSTPISNLQATDPAMEF